MVEITEEKYSVLLPTYNERDNLPIMLQLLTDAFESLQEQYEIIVIDDNSGDGTQEACRRFIASLDGRKGCFKDTVGNGVDVEDSRGRVLLRPREGKLGLGSAYVHGMRYATGSHVVILDADMSHHPKEIGNMIALMRKGDYDVISGSRYIEGGGVFGWDLTRKLVSRGANFLATFLLSTGGASDLTGSFRLYRKDALDEILKNTKSKGFVFQMEMLIRAKQLGMRVGEVPITFCDRLYYGESKMGSGEIVSYAEGLWNLFCDTE